jgi:hypothetical protein
MHIRGLHGGGEALGEGGAIIDAPEVEVKEPWLVVQAMVMEFDNLYTPGPQRDDDVLHFGGRHDEVAVDGGPEIANGLEIQGGIDAIAVGATLSWMATISLRPKLNL